MTLKVHCFLFLAIFISEGYFYLIKVLHSIKTSHKWQSCSLSRILFYGCDVTEKINIWYFCWMFQKSWDYFFCKNWGGWLMTSSMTTATSTSLLSPVPIPFSFNSSTNILKSTGEEGWTSISCNNDPLLLYNLNCGWESITSDFTKCH